MAAMKMKQILTWILRRKDAMGVAMDLRVIVSLIAIIIQKYTRILCDPFRRDIEYAPLISKVAEKRMKIAYQRLSRKRSNRHYQLRV